MDDELTIKQVRAIMEQFNKRHGFNFLDMLQYEQPSEFMRPFAVVQIKEKRHFTIEGFMFASYKLQIVWYCLSDGKIEFFDNTEHTGHYLSEGDFVFKRKKHISEVQNEIDKILNLYLCL